jgi:adenine-specific DNA-methyltransferase
MSKSINNLKYFLKEMFQFNENDLDFGIYKIYNLKRKNIEGFIDGDNTNDLAPTIEGILKEVNLENQKNDALDLYNFLKGINKELLLKEPEKNYDRIKGQLELDLDDENEKSKLIDTLNNLKKSEGITDELKDKIYNHILGFFQMYYSNGDFGYNDRSRDLYKVPYEADYNGSDTMFHWKHKGSLYIKTGTSFNAIKFELNGKKIEYRLETNENSEEEGTSQNNNKDSQLKHYRFDRIEKV